MRLGRIARHAGTRPEEQAGRDRDHGRERQDRQIEPYLVGARHRRRNQATQHANARPREAEPDHGPRGRQQSALDERLAHQREAAGAEGRADREVPGGARGPREHEIRDVGAGDEQHEHDRAQEHPQRATDVADHLVVRRHQPDAPARVGVGVLPREILRRCVSISDCACAIVTPGASRPIARYIRCGRVRSERTSSVSGDHTSTSRSPAGNWNAFGMTPTTSKVWPSS